MTQYEIQAVASLAGHPGFKGLLKLIDEADDLLLSQLQKAPADKEIHILNLWRASRRIRTLLDGKPEEFLEVIGTPNIPV